MSGSPAHDGRSRSGVWVVVAVLAVLASGCAGGSTVSSPDGRPATAPPTSSPVTPTPAPSPAAATPAPSDDPIGDRSYEVFVPASYDASVPTPLVLLLHGFSTTGAQLEAIFKLEPLAEERGFLYVHPDGTRDAAGDPFWDATDACCNASNVRVDDSAYLESVIAQVRATYNVDPRKIYLFGVSNGGFMAYRMACDHADTIAAIVSLAGATWLDAARCKPSQPVSVLEVHGTADEIVPYEGGELMPGHPFPSATTTVADWATYNGCGPDRAPTGSRLDLDAGLPGDDADVSRFGGCPTGGAVELWTVTDAGHVLPPTAAFTPSIVDFLLAHPKP